MNIVNIFKEGNYHFKKESKIFILFSITSSIILTSITTLQNILENDYIAALLSLVLVLVSILLLGSFKYMCLKALDGNELGYNDFYFGFKYPAKIYAILSSTISGPLLYFLLGNMVGLFAGSFLMTNYIMIKYPSFISSFLESNDMNAFLTSIQTINHFNAFSYMILGLSIVGGIIFMSLFSLKRIYSFDIATESVFSLDNIFKISEKFCKENRNKSIKLNLIFGLGILVISIIEVLLTLLLNLTSIPTILQNLIIDFIFFFTISLFVIYANMLIVSAYNIYLRKKVKEDNAKLVDQYKHLDE